MWSVSLHILIFSFQTLTLFTCTCIQQLVFFTHIKNLSTQLSSFPDIATFWIHKEVVRFVCDFDLFLSIKLGYARYF